MYRLLLLFSLLLPPDAMAQQAADTLALNAAGTRLSQLGDSLLKGTTDTVRSLAAVQFRQLLDSILFTPAGPQLSFGQQKALSVVVSEDEKVKAITWLVSADRGNRYRYFGYLLQRKEKKDPWQVHRLQMNAQLQRELLESTRSDSANWPGCIYYSVRHERYKKKDYYLLLGWAPQSLSTTRKYIEPLGLSPSRITIGQPAIKAGGRSRTRLVFEYSAQLSMSLRYNEAMKMIVMDHLSSSDPRPEAKGMYQLYGPDLSYDGLKFSKGQWILVKDIDVRN